MVSSSSASQVEGPYVVLVSSSEEITIQSSLSTSCWVSGIVVVWTETLAVEVEAP